MSAVTVRPVNQNEPMIIDLIGQRFGRLVVVSSAPRRPGHRAAWWLCRCDCGSEMEARADGLRTGNTRSCGCLKRDTAAATGRENATHRATRTPEYRAWAGMLTRCENDGRKDFPDYGGRGISVCERWRTFEKFLADMGHRPPGTSIDRIDNAKGYEPGNCRWATSMEQARNRRSSRVLIIGGESATVAEWAQRSGLAYDTLWARVKQGWSSDRLLCAPRRHRARKVAA